MVHQEVPRTPASSWKGSERVVLFWTCWWSERELASAPIADWACIPSLTLAPTAGGSVCTLPPPTVSHPASPAHKTGRWPLLSCSQFQMQLAISKEPHGFINHYFTFRTQQTIWKWLSEIKIKAVRGKSSKQDKPQNVYCVHILVPNNSLSPSCDWF